MHNKAEFHIMEFKNMHHKSYHTQLLLKKNDWPINYPEKST